MNAYEIPLSPVPQSFNIDLLGSPYRLLTSWCGPQNAWTLDILSPGGDPILLGIPLITGTDLLGQYAYLNLPGSLYVQDITGIDDPPNFDALGVNGLVFLVTP